MKVVITLRNTNMVSADNAGGATYSQVTVPSSQNLGQVIVNIFPGLLCSNGVELVGAVSPNNYAGMITLKRSIIGGSTYIGSTFYSSLTAGPDTSVAQFLVTDPSVRRLQRQSIRSGRPGTTPGITYRNRQVPQQPKRVCRLRREKWNVASVRQLRMVGKVVMYYQHLRAANIFE